MARSIRTTVYVAEELYADLGQAAELVYVSAAWAILGAMLLRLSKQRAPFSCGAPCKLGCSLL